MSMETVKLPKYSTEAGARAFARSKLSLAGRGIPVAIVVIVLMMALIEPRFFGRINLLNVLRNFCLLSVGSAGQMLVIMVGGFDMAIGANVALASVTTASVMVALSGLGASPVLSIVVSSLAGVLLSGVAGLLNGAIIVKLRISSFIATLATGSIIAGAVLYFTNGVTIDGLPDPFVDNIGRGFILSLPSMAWICIAFVAVYWWATGCMPFGRHVRAVGGNEKAALAAGLRVSKIRILAYGVSGFAAGLIGLLLTARVGSGDASFGATTAMETISTAVLGGTALGGGAGSVKRMLAAALLLTLASNALNMARIDSKWQALVLGLILIAAVFLERKK